MAPNSSEGVVGQNTNRTKCHLKVGVLSRLFLWLAFDRPIFWLVFYSVHLVLAFYPNLRIHLYHLFSPPCLLLLLYTPRLNEKTDSGKTHLQGLARRGRTSQRVDIPKISQFYWALFEKTRFLCSFYTFWTFLGVFGQIFLWSPPKTGYTESQITWYLVLGT